MTDPMVPMPTRRLNLYAPDRDTALWEVAREVAYQRRQSLSQLVADAVTAHLVAAGSWPPAPGAAGETQGDGEPSPLPPTGPNPSPTPGRARAREGAGEGPEVLGVSDG